MLKRERNLTIFNQVISGSTLKTVAENHQISPGRARNIVCDTYSMICKELDIESMGWTIAEMRRDERLINKLI